MQEDLAFRARRRAQRVLLRAAGTPIQTIAKTSQVYRGTVSAWIKHWAQQGAQSVHDHPRSGRPPKRTPDEQALATAAKLLLVSTSALIGFQGLMLPYCPKSVTPFQG